jgi:hypothetical protein
MERRARLALAWAAASAGRAITLAVEFFVGIANILFFGWLLALCVSFGALLTVAAPFRVYHAFAPVPRDRCREWADGACLIPRDTHGWHAVPLCLAAFAGGVVLSAIAFFACRALWRRRAYLRPLWSYVNRVGRDAMESAADGDVTPS